MNALDALGNPTRRQLLELLQYEPRSVARLAEAVPSISRPAISRHLRVLREANLVTAQAVGTANIYAVRPDGFEHVRAYLERFWDDALPRFAMVAESLDS
ncbi:MAG: winged helix-turn-helix transcriptional regulator [Deltaproteobacteria bacterium]|nr:winged helix-turn-helix transcriptional regulator [Deltaproteobacteria bacterium]